MQVSLSGVGKRFRTKWVLQDLHLLIEAGMRHVVTGKNGSGKSTLMRIIAGQLSPTCGTIGWSSRGKAIPPGLLYRHIAIAAPYMELIEEYTFGELIRFQRQLKPFSGGMSDPDLLRLSGLRDNLSQPLRVYSSGMKQRAKLSLAILSDTPLLLLDEPCSNLDEGSRHWYSELMAEYGRGKTLVIASNHNKDEYRPGDRMIALP